MQRLSCKPFHSSYLSALLYVFDCQEVEWFALLYVFGCQEVQWFAGIAKRGGCAGRPLCHGVCAVFAVSPSIVPGRQHGTTLLAVLSCLEFVYACACVFCASTSVQDRRSRL